MNSKKINICFMGSPEFSVKTLEQLNENDNIDVRLVVTAIDKKRNRNKMSPTPVKVYAQSKKLNFITIESVNTIEFLELLRSLDIDLIVVAAFGQIIGKNLLSEYKDRIINLHPSALPKFRGASPIQYTLLTGQEETAATVMLIEKQMDSGDILLSQTIPVEDNDDIISLSQKLSIIGSKLIVKTVLDFKNLYMNRRSQKHEKATYTNKITKEDGRIRGDLTTNEVMNKWRALKLFPGIYFEYNEQNIKIDKLKTYENLDMTDKVIIKKDEILLRLVDGYVGFKELQLPGKKMIPVSSYLNGNEFNDRLVNF